MYTAKIQKKSQMEIMGLVMIIILVALAMLFAIVFIVLKEPTDIRKAYTHKELAVKTGATLLKTTTSCKGQDIKQLLQDCAAGELITCENGQGSCAYTFELIEDMLDNTLKEWNKDFRFTVKQNNNQIKQYANGNCTNTDIEPWIQPLPDSMTIRLDICG